MVQKTRGRPRKFDETAALTAAMEVFWAKGYDAASLDDLTTAMGINRPSLYAAFGDKAALFEKSLAHYGETFGHAALDAFEAADTPKEAVRGFLLALIANNDGARQGRASGCFLATCAPVLAQENTVVKELLNRGMAATVDRLNAGFEQFKDEGVLAEDFPSLARAHLMVDMMHGLSHRARIGHSAKDLSAELDARVEAVLGTS